MNNINRSVVLSKTPLQIIEDYVREFNIEWRSGGNIGLHEKAYQQLFHNKIFEVLNLCWSHAIYKGRYIFYTYSLFIILFNNIHSLSTVCLIFFVDDSYTYEHRSLTSKIPYPVNCGVLQKESLFKKAHRELFIEISFVPWNKKSKKFKLIDIWLSHIDRHVVRFAFHPSDDKKQLEVQAGITDIERINNIGVINTFTGLGIRKRDINPDVYPSMIGNKEALENDPMYDHLKNIICGGSEEKTHYFLKWLAYIIQKRNKTGVAIVLQGGHGSGKGLFIKRLFEIFGKYTYTMTNVSHIQSCPTAFEEALLVLCDEVGSMNQKLYNIFKSFITESKLQNKDPHSAAREFYHFGNFIFTSNTTNLIDVIPIEPGERRFLFFNVSDKLTKDPIEKRKKYFQTLSTCDIKPFARLIYEYTPLSHLGETIEGDIDTLKAKIDNLPSFEHWWYHCLLACRISFVKKDKEVVFSWLDKDMVRSKIHAKKQAVYMCYLENSKRPQLNAAIFWKTMKKFNVCTTGRINKDNEYVVVRFNTYKECCESFDRTISASRVSWFECDENHRCLLDESKRVQDYSERYPRIGSGPESIPGSACNSAPNSIGISSNSSSSGGGLKDFIVTQNIQATAEEIKEQQQHQSLTVVEVNEEKKETEVWMSDEEDYDEVVSDSDVLDGTGIN